MDKLFLGKAITQLREGRSLSQTDLAEACGIHQPMLSLYESGKRTPSEKNLERIASALGYSTADIRAKSMKLRNAWAHGVESHPPTPLLLNDPSVIYLTEYISVKFHATVRDSKDPNLYRFNQITDLVENILRDYIEANRNEIEDMIAEEIEVGIGDVTQFLEDLKRKR